MAAQEEREEPEGLEHQPITMAVQVPPPVAMVVQAVAVQAVRQVPVAPVVALAPVQLPSEARVAAEPITAVLVVTPTPT
jgi:hypothetical protein